MNTIPLVYGIETNKQLSKQIELSKDIPSECARKLIHREVDLGLVPVAIIPQLEEAHIISDYCIGAVGAVKSVLLLSDVPFHQIEKIYLDYQSRTSVNLCKVLCNEHWNISPEFIPTENGYEANIQDTTAGVIIGDRTFHLERSYPYQYDLSEEWQKLTNLPFVFAAWVSNKKLDSAFIQLFNEALKTGLEQTERAIETQKKLSVSRESLREYLTRYIQFALDEEKKKGLSLFLSKLK